MNPGDDISQAGSGDYERPGNRYRCGRGALWRKPCGAGPSPDGQCGGVADCEPVLRDGKYQCRRPKSAGGPCAEGPKADGTCAHCHPPCIPRLTLRARRGRLTWQVCGAAALLLAAGFHFGLGKNSRPLSADPGPLSSTHAHFTAAQGCAACHAAHDTGLAGLAKAAFAHGDMTGQCIACHKFGGQERTAHDAGFPHPADQRATDCRQCHVEHQGVNAAITRIADEQCHTCHQVKFQSFTRGHPEFTARFAHRADDRIKFNHGKHLGEYFTRADFKTRAPADCSGCHVAARDEREVRTLGFDAACAGCHAAQISQNELVLLRLPEPTAPADLPKLTADDATTFMKWMVQPTSTNAADYGPGLSEWFGKLAKNGVGELMQSVGARSIRRWETNVLAGLSAELIQRPVSLWREQKKFEPATGAVLSGWYWMEDLYPELRYKPAGHGDAVARAWVEMAIQVPAIGEGNRDAAWKFRAEVTQASTGVGRCLKCHAVSSASGAKGVGQIDWTFPPRLPEAHTKFSHGPHLPLLACRECHELDPKADYDSQFKDPVRTTSVSSFRAIGLSQCAKCHVEEKVRADCLLCHQYHRRPNTRDLAAGPP